MTTTIKKRKARSPYQKYGKQPFQYHLSLKTWRTAVKERRERDAEVARRAHDAFLGNDLLRAFPPPPARADRPDRSHRHVPPSIWSGKVA